MPKKEREFPLKDMNELEEVFYGKSGDGKDIDWGKYRRYNDWLQTEAQSPTFEATAKQIFSPLGNVEKIPEIRGKKTFDFRIDQSKILLEVTSLGVTPTALPTTFNDNLILRKLQEAINHIKEKDTPSLPGFFKGGAIIYETVFNLMTKFHLGLDAQLPVTTGILNNELDFLAFIPQPASIDGHDSFDEFPIVFYVKEGPLIDLFRSAFQNKKYTIFVV